MSSNNTFSIDDLNHCLERSKDYGFISDQPLENQIKHSIDFLSAIPTEAINILDLGAGGGLPSLVFLHLFDGAKITAIDAMKKRTEFLANLSLEYPGLRERLEIVNGRAESLAFEPRLQHSFDLVIARGFGSPQVTAECSTRFLKVGGKLIVSGRPKDEAGRWDNDGLALLGLKLESVLENGMAHAALLYKYSLESPKYPRRASAMKNTPLW